MTCWGTSRAFYAAVLLLSAASLFAQEEDAAQRKNYVELSREVAELFRQKAYGEAAAKAESEA